MGSVFVMCLVAGLNPNLGRGYRIWWQGYAARVFALAFAIAVYIPYPETKLLDLLPLSILSNLSLSGFNLAVESLARRHERTAQERSGASLGMLLGVGLLGISILARVLILHSD